MTESVHLRCPYCGERFETFVDASGGDADYVEDCPVCCRPIEMHLAAGADGAHMEVSRDD